MAVKISKLFLLGIALLTACSEENIQFQDVDDQSWQQEEALSFSYSKDDNSKIPTLIIRHTEAYPYQNIWLKLSNQKKGEDQNFKRSEFKVAQPDGKWIGKKKGAFYKLSIPLDNIECADSCELIIQQNMRDNPLRGIQSIGLSFN